MILKLLGYWKDEFGSWIDPTCLIDETMDNSRKNCIAEYIQSGTSIRYMYGCSYCRIKTIPPVDDFEMGNQELTDGEYIWPSGLFIYVKRFSVRLPEVFENKAMTLKRCPKIDTKCEYDIDYGFWERWCIENGGQGIVDVSLSHVDWGDLKNIELMHSCHVHLREDIMRELEIRAQKEDPVAVAAIYHIKKMSERQLSDNEILRKLFPNENIQR